eukprot:NODE_2337_length_1144_cov_247.369863_g1943_i0.p2 GENE.NODE_2337_length_1144_cov_247.369863_g1943_i0~~NODE_2337_length_1144_cov_247.369863_g1943_i0.p2  ORF type:complete len:146 (+),score=54.02 NODE_2337_length_1144_cov_247.369863_g1943_i0:116-553(+)
MATRLRKNRKKRGHVSAGHGRVGKHRKHPSGRGNAGLADHHRIWVDKYHPGYFGKVGIRHFHWKKNVAHCPTVNVERIATYVSEADKKSTKGSQNLPVVDLTSHGKFKLLGKGNITTPLIVKARYVSRIAEKKVKAAGGTCVLSA